MAVTGFWPVFKNLKATLDYADNPDKTTAPEYLDEDLYAALRYAENDDKTDRKMFVGGINCSAQNAYAEMIAVQWRFGLRGKVVGYHGIHTVADLQANIEQSKAELSALERERSVISNRIRRPKSPEEQAQNKERRKAVSGQMKPAREHLRRAERILKNLRTCTNY